MTQDTDEAKYPKRIVLGRGIPSRADYGIFLNEKAKDGSWGSLIKASDKISTEPDQDSPEYDLVLIRVAKPKAKKQGIST